MVNMNKTFSFSFQNNNAKRKNVFLKDVERTEIAIHEKFKREDGLHQTFYIDTRYNDKTRDNDNSTVTKSSLKR